MEGQSNGINKGFQKATGDIIAWLNSDDYYFQGVLSRVAQEINPQKKTLCGYWEGVFK